jgi:hypothetical protein
LIFRFQRGPHFLHTRGVRFGQPRQCLVHAVGELLQAAALLIAPNQALRFQLAAHALELLHRRRMRGLRRGLQLHPHLTLDALDALGQAAFVDTAPTPPRARSSASTCSTITTASAASKIKNSL